MAGLQKVESVGHEHVQFGPELWQGFTAGMSIEQATAVSGVELDPNPEKLANGAVSELIIRNYTISSQDYTVHLYFFRNRLIQVTLTLDGIAALSTAHEIAALLRAKYGPELMKNEPNTEHLGVFNAQWLAQNGVNISLFCMEEIAFNINYQMRVAYESAKL